MKMWIVVVALVASGCSKEVLPWVAQERAERRAELAEAQVQALQTAITMASARDAHPLWTQVRRGETIWDIAKRTNVSVADIMSENHLIGDDLTKLWTGRPLLLPEWEDVQRSGSMPSTATANR